MEDLLPFLFFIVIALVQVAKFFMKNGSLTKNPHSSADGTLPERKASTLEQFFSDLAEKLEPRPAPLPDWPEGRERPDYLQEVDDFKVEQHSNPSPVVEPIPMPEPAIQKTPVAVVIAPVQISSSAFAGSSRMRLPSVPMMRSNTSGHINVNLKDRKKLKEALIASLIFTQPRAYDQSFDTTLAK